MTEAELLDEVKTRLSITGEYHDSLLTSLIVDVKDYMNFSGVVNLSGNSAVGCIARGVADLWNFGSGEGKFSDFFYQRVTQLSLEEKEIPPVIEDEEIDTPTDEAIPEGE